MVITRLQWINPCPIWFWPLLGKKKKTWKILPQNFVTLWEEMQKYIREICHAGGKFCPTCMEITIFPGPVLTPGLAWCSSFYCMYQMDSWHKRLVPFWFFCLVSLHMHSWFHVRFLPPPMKSCIKHTFNSTTQVYIWFFRTCLVL